MGKTWRLTNSVFDKRKEHLKMNEEWIKYMFFHQIIGMYSQMSMGLVEFWAIISKDGHLEML